MHILAKAWVVDSRKKSLEGKLPPEHGFLVPELTSQSDGPAKGPDFSQTIFSKIARNYV